MRYISELCGAEAPVYQGAGKPLDRPLEDATWFHGLDGLGDHRLGDQCYPAPRKMAEAGSAVEAIIESARRYPGLELVTLGPLTNIAMALQKQPGLVDKLSRAVVMGGAPCCVGNVTPAAEYNIWTDPEAARVVLRSDLPIDLIGWQLCRGEAVLHEPDIAQVLSLKTELARFAIECNSHARRSYL